jgi:hypothetical protein
MPEKNEVNPIQDDRKPVQDKPKPEPQPPQSLSWHDWVNSLGVIISFTLGIVAIILTIQCNEIAVGLHNLAWLQSAIKGKERPWFVAVPHPSAESPKKLGFRNNSEIMAQRVKVKCIAVNSKGERQVLLQTDSANDILPGEEFARNVNIPQNELIIVAFTYENIGAWNIIGNEMWYVNDPVEGFRHATEEEMVSHLHPEQKKKPGTSHSPTDWP